VFNPRIDLRVDILQPPEGRRVRFGDSSPYFFVDNGLRTGRLFANAPGATMACPQYYVSLVKNIRRSYGGKNSSKADDRLVNGRVDRDVIA